MKVLVKYKFIIADFNSLYGLSWTVARYLSIYEYESFWGF